jgi:RNA polymerase sigma-70 factor (ECF subfamily)
MIASVVPLQVSTAEAQSPRDDDTPLLGRVARGDSRALKTLYDRHAGRALGLALRILSAQGEAEEIVQETFLEVWRRARDYDAARGSAAAWIATIARTRAIDRLRARSAASRTRRALAAEPAREAAPTPLEDVEQRAARERIAAAMATLPDEQRKPIELAFFEGLSYPEIAERTDAPLGTIKTRVRLGMEKLAAQLKGVRP